MTVGTANTGPSLATAKSPSALDGTDLAVLRVLVEEARTSQRGLARRIGMSPPAVGERIARLERMGVIRGYRADVDYGALGAPLIVFLGVVAVQGHDQRNLVRDLGGLPEVESVDVITGPLDLLVRLRLRDHAHLRETLFDRIWPLHGVNRTETFISLDSMEPKDFGTSFLAALLGSSLPTDASSRIDER